jgi:hypothetical protein
MYRIHQLANFACEITAIARALARLKHGRAQRCPIVTLVKLAWHQLMPFDQNLCSIFFTTK